jgi:hypothetical protein
MPADQELRPGDTVVFFYAPSGGDDPGFYGWAVILDVPENSGEIYFRPIAPSDALKMCPWWDDTAKELANDVRGKVKQGTMFLVTPDLRNRIRLGIRSWLGGAG